MRPSETTLVFKAQQCPVVNLDPVEPGVPMYKYVDLSHAHHLERGSIKIGTLRSYGLLESERRDAEEHSIFRPGSDLRAGNPKHRAYLEGSGLFAFSGEGRQSSIKNVNIETTGSDLNCVCFSEADDCGKGFGAEQALFRIDDPAALAERLTIVAGIRSPWHIGRVRYKERVANLNGDEAEQPNPFVKPARFSGEQEVRIIWENPTDSELSIICGSADAQIAKLMTRIR
ncbi:hypothetical protein ASG11_09880 [Sphingomonas sp. Leaf357]|nr:hypothetical protein ASG11_09880 [Sphingomonas sp. Leaf357]